MRFFFDLGALGDPEDEEDEEEEEGAVGSLGLGIGASELDLRVSEPTFLPLVLETLGPAATEHDGFDAQLAQIAADLDVLAGAEDGISTDADEVAAQTAQLDPGSLDADAMQFAEDVKVGQGILDDLGPLEPGTPTPTPTLPVTPIGGGGDGAGVGGNLIPPAQPEPQLACITEQGDLGVLDHGTCRPLAT